MEVRGDFAEMKRFLGTAKLTNLIAEKTRKLDAKRRNQCEGINSKAPHTPDDGEGPLQLSHNPWRSRLDVLKDCLAKYKEGDEPITSTTIYYVPDLNRFEDEFIEAHLPWESSGKILCKICDREWTNTWKLQNGQLVSPTQPMTALSCSPLTIEQLTVELIFRGLTNTEVLAGIRERFPGRASINTVRWYRSHLIHDNSPRFDRLRAGRTLPISSR